MTPLWRAAVLAWAAATAIPQAGLAAEVVLYCGRAETYLGTLVEAVRRSPQVPPPYRAQLDRWCREGRLRYDPEREKSVTFTGALLMDRIVLGRDTGVDPRAPVEADIASCIALGGVGDSLHHELVHLVSGSGHGEGNAQEDWTAAWGRCTTGWTLRRLSLQAPRLVACRRVYEKPELWCRHDELRPPRGFTPPAWWPAYLSRDRRRQE